MRWPLVRRKCALGRARMGTTCRADAAEPSTKATRCAATGGIARDGLSISEKRKLARPRLAAVVAWTATRVLVVAQRRSLTEAERGGVASRGTATTTTGTATTTTGTPTTTAAARRQRRSRRCSEKDHGQLRHLVTMRRHCSPCHQNRRPLTLLSVGAILWAVSIKLRRAMTTRHLRAALLRTGTCMQHRAVGPAWSRDLGEGGG